MGVSMMGKKHKPPSRERYEQNNPNWTVRLTLFLFDALQTFLEKSGLSRRDFIAIALKKQEMDYERIRTEGYNEGITDGEIEGYNKGKSDGFIDGKQVGYEEGHQIGYSEGHDQGIYMNKQKIKIRYGTIARFAENQSLSNQIQTSIVL